MDKQILRDYVDACELIKETEADIRKLEKKKKHVVVGSVKGSMQGHPYCAKNFHIEGVEYDYQDDIQLRMEEKLLGERKENAERIKSQAQAIINQAPVRIQRIIRFRYWEGLSWNKIADTLGRGASEDSIRMELDRYLTKN